MPAPNPLSRRRRSLVESEDDDTDDQPDNPDVDSAGSSQPYISSKRVRLNDGSARPSPGPSLHENDLVESSATSHSEGDIGDTRGFGEEDYQPGSIVRVKLKNFVTYTAVEFRPGPSLNMVIGPNGTGKSTLVCAICLGLGWGPQHLGRAKDVGEYVKYGTSEATIEIELAGEPGRHKYNPVIRRQIRKEGNKSTFYISGKPALWKEVQKLARSFSIQIDNLCQFLPQDKVCEFAGLTPVELLYSTQRAAAPPQMLEWHEELKRLRNEQKKLQEQQNTDSETLQNLEGRQQLLRADVERLRERDEIKAKIALLELARPFAKYREARQTHLEMKTVKREAQAALKVLEESVEPSLRAITAKEQYKDEVENVTIKRRRLLNAQDASVDELGKKIADTSAKVDELRKEKDAEKRSDARRLADTAAIQGRIKGIERQMNEKPPQFDLDAFKEQSREKSRMIREIGTQIEEIKEVQRGHVSQGKEKNIAIQRAERELEALNSQVGQKTAKLKTLSRDTARAWEWIQENQDSFEHRVFGPPVVECSVKDPAYTQAVESLFQKNDLLTFTCQSQNDLRKLSNQLYKNLGLAEISIRTISKPLSHFQPPVSLEQMHAYGFDGWAADYISGPEPVMAMLCGECGLMRTGVSLEDISSEQYSSVENSPISTWVTKSQMFQITRRREYGPGATSTRVKELRKAQIWTDQPADMDGKRELFENIEGWKGEVEELKRRVNEQQVKKNDLQRKLTGIEKDKLELDKDKANQQKIMTEFNGLSTKLDQEREKLRVQMKLGTERRARVLDIVAKVDSLVYERAQLAVDYTIAIEALQQLHIDLYAAELALIEAGSDLEILKDRSKDVTDHLTAKRAEVKDIERRLTEAHAMAKRCLTKCQPLLSAASEEENTFLNTLPKDQTPQDLENEIESEKARLELVHEGNPNALNEFESRQQNIDGLRTKLEELEESLGKYGDKIAEIREKWEPELEALIAQISAAFGHNFEQIGCAGQVGISKPADDFDAWAIEILVKFRENEPLTLLTAHRQSGGERAVSTIFYLMSLQTLARSPFRVVDEINQGMDPRNERVVHERMVDIACEEGKGQYFLVTPKLLNGLRYHRRMRVMCIASGEYMPKKNEGLEFGRLVLRARTLKATASAA